ncbi:MAG: hypothetical protein IKR27_08655, partial [Lachnospiraceae bacterium]|nr:hypothetical protein [Lachnospiraceae bacterium]
KRKVSKELETAYNGMISACEVLGEPKYKVDRLIEPKKKSEGGGYDYSAKLKTEVAADKKAENKVAAKTLKDEYLSKLSDAISASQNYIDKLYEEIEKKREEVNKRREEERKNKKKGKKTEKKGSDSRVVHIVAKDDANKYDEYVSAKAFMDYYEKNLGKDSEEYQKEKELYEKLRKDPDVKMVEAAVQNREALMKAYEKFEKLDESMASLKAGLEDLNKKLGVEIKKEEKTDAKEVKKSDAKEKKAVNAMKDPYIEKGFDKIAKKHVRDHRGGAIILEANLKKMKMGRMNLDVSTINVAPEKKKLAKK